MMSLKPRASKSYRGRPQTTFLALPFNSLVRIFPYAQFYREACCRCCRQAIEIAQQKADLAELKQFIADLIAPAPAPEPVKVDSRPEPKEWTHAETQAWVAADAAKRRADEKARHDEARVGLQDGEWRDGGLIRDRQGKIVLDGAALKQKLAKEAEFEKAARAEDLAWRRKVGIEVRHGAGDNADPAE